MSTNYNLTLQINNSSLEEIIEQLNNMPDAGGGANPTLQDKTVTPTTSKQTVTADSGYDGLDTVTVNAMPTATQATPSITVNTSGLITATATQTAGYVAAGTKSATQQLTTQAAQTITPGTTDKTIASGRYLTGTQTIKGDSNLVAANIVSGKTIFGVAGTATAGGGSAAPNGTAWTASNITSANIEDVLYANGVWTAAGGNNIFHSCDGKNWISYSTNSSVGTICYGNGIWIASKAGGSKTSKYYTSENGISWTERTVPHSADVYAYGISFLNGLFFSLSDSTIYYSTNGYSWTQATGNDFSPCAKSIAYGNGYYVAAPASTLATGVYISTNGKNWTKSGPTDTIFRVFYLNGIYYANSNSNLYYSNNNCQTWNSCSLSPSPSQKIFYSIYCANGIWAGGGSGLGIYYSTDGKTWIQSNTGNKSIQFVINDNNVWIAGTNGSYMTLYSTDGKIWSDVSAPKKTNCAYYANGIWVLGAQSDGLLYSIGI